MLQISMISTASTIHLWSNNLTSVKEFKQTENNILEALSDVNNNLKKSQETLCAANRNLDIANANVKAWKSRKKQLENKLKETREEWEKNNV